MSVRIRRHKLPWPGITIRHHGHPRPSPIDTLKLTEVEARRLHRRLGEVLAEPYLEDLIPNVKVKL